LFAVGGADSALQNPTANRGLNRIGWQNFVTQCHHRGFVRYL